MYENWAGDAEVTKYLMWKTHENSDSSRSILESWIGQYDQKDFYLWAITILENGDKPIGSISVVEKNDATNMVQIGYCIGQKWWNQGITSEALAAVIRFFFTQVGVNRIEARHDPKNPNSGRVMLKNGMRHEGTLREADWNNQGVCDAAIYSILRKEFNPNE